MRLSVAAVGLWVESQQDAFPGMGPGMGVGTGVLTAGAVLLLCA